jgi:hypothetical protein
MGNLKRKQRARIVEALVDGYLDEVRALSSGGEPHAISAAGLFGGALAAVVVAGSNGDEHGQPATPHEEQLAARVLARYRAVRPDLGSWYIRRVYSRHAGIASYPLLRLQAVLEERSERDRASMTIEIKESVGQPARLVTEIQREFDRPVHAPRDLDWTIIGRREFRARRVLQDERRFSVERIAKELKAGRATKADVLELALRTGRLLALGHCTSRTRDGKPGVAHILTALPPPDELRHEVLDAAARRGELNKQNARMFRWLVARYGGTLGWRSGSD